MSSLPRKEQIVRAALHLLAELPMEEVTTRRLAAELGLSQPALFRHFVNREALLCAVVETGRRDLEQVALAVLEGEAPALERLRQLGTAILLHVEAHPGFPRLLFASALPGAGPVREAMRHVVNLQGALVATIVREGQEAGELDRFVDPADGAGLYLGMLQGLVLRWEVGGRVGRATAEFAGLFGLWARAVGARGARPAPEPPAAPAVPAVPARGRAIQWVDGVALIAAGTDPLATVLGVLATLPPGGVLLLRAPFRPAPLLALLSRRGLQVADEPLAHGEWLLTAVLRAAPIEDLRDLEPPEPLERVLEAEAALPAGGVYLARVPRMPQLLLPRLFERQTEHTVEPLPDGSALVRLERR